MLKLLLKTLGLSFYQQHAGLFLVAFYFLFGAVEGSQLVNYHLSLIIAICSSPFILFLLLTIWAGYAAKAVFFVQDKLSTPAYHFTKDITAVPMPKQYKLWFKVYLFLCLPILIYAVFILFIAIKYQYYSSFFAIIFGLISMAAFPALSTFKRSNFRLNPIVYWIKIPSVSIRKPFWTWPLFRLLNEQRLVLFVCKVVSILSFKAILWAFADVGNDTRVYLTALLAVVLSHSVLILNLIKFDAFYMTFVSSLAISPLKRLSNWIVILFILILPELGLLSWLITFNLSQFFYAMVFCMGAMLSLFTFVCLLKANMEHYMKLMLFFFFITMLAILANYYLLYSLSLLLGSIGIFIWRYTKIDLKELA